MNRCKIPGCSLSMSDSNLCSRHDDLWLESLERKRAFAADREASPDVAFVDFITRVSSEERNELERGKR